MSIIEAARRAAKDFDADIIIIKKSSSEYRAEKDPPPCPSVAVNGTIISRNAPVTYDQLKTAILGESGR